MDWQRDYEELIKLQALRPDDFGPATVVEMIEADRAIAPGIADQLEWDDAVAGRGYREIQVRQIMRRTLRLVPQPEGQPPQRVRAFLAVRRAAGEPGDHQYQWRQTTDVLAAPIDRGRALALFERQIRDLVHTYRTLDPGGVRAVLRRIADELGGEDHLAG